MKSVYKVLKQVYKADDLRSIGFIQSSSGDPFPLKKKKHFVVHVMFNSADLAP